LKTLIKWTALAVVVAAVLVIARDPMYWLRRSGFAVHGSGELPPSFFTPRTLVRGGNQPPAPRETPGAEQLDPAALQTAADYAEKQHSRALIVTRHGYIVFERYWQGSNLDTVVESPGLGRVLAALATGVAISERKIGWPDEPIGYLIPAWSKDARGEITVRNLLQMSSGLGSSTSTYSTNIVSRYLNLPSEASPGKRWRDQSVDPDLLAYVIQKATGQPYAEYLSQAIWARIGAGDAWIWLDGPGGDAHVDAGFFVRQGDWLRVAELLLQNGNYQGDEVIVPRWVPELLQPVKSNTDYGSYLRLGTHPAPGMSPYATSDVFVVEGGGNRLWLVPSLQIAILRTGGQPASDWDEGRIPNLIIQGAHDFVPAAARPGADIRQLVPNH
jgi:CubicO group peptidase (beta-lactamase class C family)